MKEKQQNTFPEDAIKHVLITNELLKKSGPSKILPYSAYSYKHDIDTVCNHCKRELAYTPKRYPIWEATMVCPICKNKQWESTMVLSLT